MRDVLLNPMIFSIQKVLTNLEALCRSAFPGHSIIATAKSHSFDKLG